MKQDKYELLQTALEYAQKLNQGTIQAAQYYRNGEIEKGHEYVTMITEGLEWLINGLVILEDVLIKELDVTTINDLIEEYITATENDDIVLMADLLEYEIAETIQSWYEILAQTINQNIEMDIDEA